MNVKIEKASLYKLGITVCLAMIISLFLFACESSRNSGAGTETDTSGVIQDTSGAMRDTGMMNSDTAARIPPDSMR